MGTSELTSATVIEAPPAAVFAILADPRQHPRIDGSGTVRGSISGPDLLVLGSEFVVDMSQGLGYKTKNRVVEHEPDRLIAWRHVGLHRWRYRLEPIRVGGLDATRVTETWDLSAYPGVARRVLVAWRGRATQAGIEQTLVNLKAAAESDAAGSAGAGAGAAGPDAPGPEAP